VGLGFGSKRIEVRIESGLASDRGSDQTRVPIKRGFGPDRDTDRNETRMGRRATPPEPAVRRAALTAGVDREPLQCPVGARLRR